MPASKTPNRISSKFVPGRVLGIAAIGAVGWAVSDAAEISGHNGDITRFLLAFSVILLAAKVGGELFDRLHQPAVLGELVFGVVLGNLGVIGLGFVDALKDAPFLAIAAEIGVILLLFEVGLATDLDELLAVGPSALTVALLGVIAPISLGYFASTILMPEDAEWYVHAFVGATLAATSVGITARVLKDIGKMGAPESKVILGAAVVDDILGLVVLAFVLGLIRSADSGTGLEFGALPIVLIVAKAVGFLAGSVLMGRWIVVPLVSVVRKARSRYMPVVLAIAYCFVMSALAELFGLADIVGAFAAGLVIDDAITRRFGTHSGRYRLDSLVAPISAIFVPVFFVYMGMRVDLPSFAFTEVLVFAAALSVVAIVSKFVSALGVLEKGLNRWAVGLGMIPRGEVGLIFAGVGSTVMVGGAPVFSPETFSAIVAMVMVTTLATPPLLKAAFANVGGEATPTTQGSVAGEETRPRARAA